MVRCVGVHTCIPSPPPTPIITAQWETLKDTKPLPDTLPTTISLRNLDLLFTSEFTRSAIQLSPALITEITLFFQPQSGTFTSAQLIPFATIPPSLRYACHTKDHHAKRNRTAHRLFPFEALYRAYSKL
eukprot:GHVO01029276.1.p2 GENE.GHVO01029276.1~~GHVO01029276.1.p2  ORF type:complete len:129 (-),score=9.77 GHVO01029276.1:383-769(-)